MFKIGFTARNEGEPAKSENEILSGLVTTPRKSVVRIYFPARNMTLAYYNHVHVRLRLQFVTNLIVAFVEFLLVALLSLAFCSNFRYCVSAKNENGGVVYDEAASSETVSVLRRNGYRDRLAAW